MERMDVQMVNELEVWNSEEDTSSYLNMSTTGSKATEGVRTVRRAGLIDIPAVSRMLRAPSLADWPLPGGISDDALTSATRLMLTHIGLEHGEFWVALEDERVCAAVVLLPPTAPQTLAGNRQRLEEALQLELGLTPGVPDHTDIAQLAAQTGAPQTHWLLMPLHSPGDDDVLDDLLAAALPAVDETGMPVICLEQGASSPAIRSAGFEPLAVPADLDVTASLRPGLQAPDDAGALFAVAP